MRRTAASPLQSPVEDIAWIGDVKEVLHPIDISRPLWVRTKNISTGPSTPQPSVPHPEVHPYCEFSVGLKGRGTQYIGSEKTRMHGGEVVLMGPGVPHYGFHTGYPQHGITIHFSPTLLVELGPRGDGVRMLSRFTASQSLARAVLRPPPQLFNRLFLRAESMQSEFRSPRVGTELRLRALLSECIVDIMRWEEDEGRATPSTLTNVKWSTIEQTLHHLHENYADPLYVEQVAKAAGLSVSRLQAMFRDAFGMSCMQYLRYYRIWRATAMLCMTGARVTEVAFAVGFETLSHFNSSFKAITGFSPSDFMRSTVQKRS